MLKWALVIWLSTTISVDTYESASVLKCLWHRNSCVDSCPEWMVVSESNCQNSYWQAQRTCQHPHEMLVGTVCGFSRCDCPDPKVLDTDSGFCYDVDNCPPKHAEKRK